MSTPVTDALINPARRPEALKALTQVIDEEVAAKRGFAGAAVKAALAIVGRMGNFVERATNRLLPDFAKALDPFWISRGDVPFGTYLSSRGAEATAALLAVTDAKAQSTSNAAAAKAYQSLRGKAKDHVEAALPRLGATVQSLMGS